MRRLAAVVLMAIPGPALPPHSTHPGFVDAAQLLAACAAEGPDALVARAVCLGYVTGAADQLLARPPQRGGPRICPPDSATPQEAVAAVRMRARWLQDAHRVGAADFTRAALERAYPCEVERSRR